MTRLGIRHRLLFVVVAAVALALAGLVAGFNVVLHRSLSRNADNLVRARAAAELAQLRIKGGRIVLGEAPDEAAADAQVWIFSGQRQLEAPRAGAVVTQAARVLASEPSRLVDVSSADIRLYSAPVIAGGRRTGTVVAGVSLAPYEETRRTALVGSLAFAAVVLLLVALAARWLLTSSLRPVAQMTRQASTWSETDADRRFGLGTPHDELTELAATLDRLLERLATGLRREQRFSAELSHELRTPLARVLAETEVALRRERTPAEYRNSLELVRRNAGQLTRTIDALVAAARHEAGAARGTADAYTVATDAAEACGSINAEQTLGVAVERPAQPLRLGVERDLAQRILQPILENACRYGRGKARVSIKRAGSSVVYRIEDDGPGVADEERERIFEPGIRGRLGNDGEAGAGLGLSLARRLARSVAGDVGVEPGGTGGRFVVRLPSG